MPTPPMKFMAGTLKSVARIIADHSVAGDTSAALTATHHRAVIDNPAQPKKICFLPEKYLVGATTQRADV
jgi:hypothetical protein